MLPFLGPYMAGADSRSIDGLKSLASCCSVDAFLDELRRCLDIVSDSCARVALVVLVVYEAGF